MGFEPGEIVEKKSDAWEGEDEDDGELKVREILIYIAIFSELICSYVYLSL